MSASHSIDPQSIPWKRISAGVYRKDCAYNKGTKQFLSFFKIEKGARLKTHKHFDREWVYVIDGVYEDEFDSAKKGSIKINTKGSVHTSQSRKGCLLLVIWSGKHIPTPAAKRKT